jgi:hypothetical protein
MTHAGVDKQAQGKRKVFADVEVEDSLGAIVDLKDEALLGQVLDESFMLVAHDNRNVNQVRIHECGRDSCRSPVAFGCRSVQNRLLGRSRPSEGAASRRSCATQCADSHDLTVDGNWGERLRESS